MKKIISKLENTYVKGILIKKGENSLTDKDFDAVNKSPVFQTYVKYGHVNLISAKEKPAAVSVAEQKQVDFSKMPYNELLAYAKKNGLKPKTNKKEDILTAIELQGKEE